MRRRDFVAGGIALAAKAALPSSGGAQSAAPRIERIIDAHCHVFNAADLPIEGFAKKIMVPKSAQTSELVARFADYPGALEALVHAITVQVKRAAPDMQRRSIPLMNSRESPGRSRLMRGARTKIAGTCAARCSSSGSIRTFSASAPCH
jgi:hypothetical protein